MSLHLVEEKVWKTEFLNAFEDRNALLTVKDGEGCNPMTIGWCQVGRLWRLPVCTVYVRPERYTDHLLEKEKYFTVSVMPEERKTAVAYCGSHSGRDSDKVQACGLTVRHGAGDAPFFEEAEMVLVCRKLFTQDMTSACCEKDERVLRFYGEAEGGWHRSYIGEIVEVYQAD